MADFGSAARSSLEEMLESLRKRTEKPKDTLPRLPSRPTKRGRLPSLKKSLPVDIRAEAKVSDTEETATMGFEEIVSRTNIFRNKRLADMDQSVESPYVKMARFDNGEEISVKSMDDKFELKATKKLNVWCRLADTEWQLGNIQEIKGQDVGILLSNNNVLTVSVDNVLPANPDILNNVDDLVKLSYLNEPSVLHSLKCRYASDIIYTKAGPVLVAINPFKEVPLYGNDIASAYREKKNDSPHVYALAHSAYSGMMRDGSSQSIIISGESGAGKTETAKVVMQYLSALGGDRGIELKVLQAHVILEAFGNAKTSSNDNSSRYGKMMELHFNKGGKICGAKIQTLLLEKSRVVEQEQGERSYHVFYQLCAGAPEHLKEKLNLKAAEKYEYLNQSDCLRISGVDDAQRFHMLMQALDIVCISKEDQENIFVMLAAVLWLGNIAFQVVDNDNHVEVVTDEALTCAAKLMGCQVSDLKMALSTRKLTLSDAIVTRNALAKSIYDFLFDRLVEQINKSLEVEQMQISGSISILDIHGFEAFQRNGFEQLCINYANERLQQLFIKHLFNVEQEEYIQEGIGWTNVEFVNNKECLNLFEKRPLGLLSLLDEESTFSQATDSTLSNKLKQHLDGNPCFKGEKGHAFGIRHCSGEVVYDTSGFLEKNRDVLHSDSVKLLSSCDNHLFQLCASYLLDRSDSRKQTLGSKFKDQLLKLMQYLENTTPHFIQCIKPNTKQLPGLFENNHVLHQLRCCGVLNIVKISKAGYPIRITHRRFAERYGFLLLENVAAEDPLSISVSVLNKFNVLPEMYQVGYTKLFFRTGQIALLENIRNQTVQGILCVQKYLRGMKARRKFQELKGSSMSSIAKEDVRSKTHQKKLSRGLDTNSPGKDTKEEHPEDQSSVFAELEMQISKTEATLREKEEENKKLRKEIHDYEKRCTDNEARMKSMEETWKTQIASLQSSLGAAKKSQQLETHNHNPEITPTDKHSPDEVGSLLKEYEQRKHEFENDAKLLVESKQSGSSADTDEGLKKLKSQFAKWKKDYKVRLRDAKKKLRKNKKEVSSEEKTQRRRWLVTKRWKLCKMLACNRH